MVFSGEMIFRLNFDRCVELKLLIIRFSGLWLCISRLVGCRLWWCRLVLLNMCRVWFSLWIMWCIVLWFFSMVLSLVRLLLVSFLIIL